jgi:hypothetical protein
MSMFCNMRERLTPALARHGSNVEFCDRSIRLEILEESRKGESRYTRSLKSLMTLLPGRSFDNRLTM